VAEYGSSGAELVAKKWLCWLLGKVGGNLCRRTSGSRKRRRLLGVEKEEDFWE